MIKIVLVEDDVLLSNLLVERLSKEGFHVTSVTDGRFAIETIKKVKPDLLLQDLILPTVDGYEILDVKRKDNSIKDIPVIVISNSGQPVEIKHLVERGVNDYFIKAELDLNEIVERVRMVLDSKFKNKGNISRWYDLSGKTLLWIEDDPLVDDVLNQKLSGINVKIIQVPDGKSAFKFLKDRKPDIIILDIVLPDMSGLDFLERVKLASDTRHIPVLILSNMNSDNEYESSMKLGASDYLVKSTHSIDQVITKIDEIIRISELQ